MNDPIFLNNYVKGPIFPTFWYMHISFAHRFFEAACSLGIQWIDCDICLTTSNKWVQKIKDMNRSTFRMIKYMNGSVFSKTRNMNGVGFEILARTLLPQVPPLPSSHPPPPQPPRIYSIRKQFARKARHFLEGIQIITDSFRSPESVPSPLLLISLRHSLEGGWCAYK